MTVKHRMLVDVAERWLRTTAGCSVVGAEITSGASHQTPDAIGFKSDNSYLVECKVSRGDFFADGHKWHQESPERSMGNYRWYLTPQELLIPDDLPKGWGLLEHNEWTGRVNVIVGSLRPPKWAKGAGPKAVPIQPKGGIAHRFNEINLLAERSVLFSMLRRQQD